MNTKKLITSLLLLLAMSFASMAISYNADLGTLNPGGTITQSGSTVGYSNIYGQGGSDYVYRIYISGATTLEVNTNYCGWDSYLHLLDASDTRLAYNDDSGLGGGGASLISGLSISSPGYYFIVVDGYSSGSSGSYTLNIISTGSSAALTAGSITIGTTSVSSGSSPGTITNSVSPSGGTGSYTYQWQQSSDNANWTSISGATSDYYTVPALYATTYYRRAVTSGTVAYSNTVVISVTSPTLSAGSITIGTTSVYSGSSPGTITNAVSPSGGTGSYTYQWQKYQIGDADWSNISGATSDYYTVPALYVTTYYRRVVTSGTVAYSGYVCITVTASDLSGGSITIGTTSVSSGSSPGTITNAASPSGGTGSYTYQWQQSSDNANWTSISGATSDYYTVPALYATTYYRRSVTSGTVAYSNTVLISVTQTLTGGTISIGTTSVSSGSSPGAFTNAASPSGGTGSYAYQWQQSSDNANWSNISGQTSATYTVPALSATTYFRRAVTSGTTAYSNTVQITVTNIGSSVSSVNSLTGTVVLGLSSSVTGTQRTIGITNGTGITIDVADNDNSSTNEIQNLSISGNTLSISGGNSVALPTATYPGAGISVSTGSAWGTSIVNNSANWNTAYSWGNHAGLYRSISYVPSWSEITSKPTTVSGFGITDAMTTSHAANSITSANITSWNAKQSTITLTTTGTSGAATLAGNTLNIPQYTSGIQTLSISGNSLTISGTGGNSVTLPTATYPGAGIPVSTGSAWTTSIANNSANWNTAYSWGNHAGLYRPISYVPAWSEITSKPTTVSGFGITDAMTTGHAANSITSANISTWNAKQSAITLTTTGTSGAATLVGNTLNIPQYSSGSGGSWTTNGSNYTTGSVSIGTTSFPSGYKLAVSGKIIAEEVMVKTVSTWPDYVFGKDYSLKSLPEVENHIKMYGHLPEVPSAQEVKENGIGLSEMDQILLKKVEEMTLYILELEKRVKELETK